LLDPDKIEAGKVELHLKPIVCQIEDSRSSCAPMPSRHLGILR
jgi:hypothetical protein